MLDKVKQYLLMYLMYIAKTLNKQLQNGVFIQQQRLHIGVIDIPRFANRDACKSFVDSIQKYGYQWINIGLTPIRLKKLPERWVQWFVQKKIIKSFHGTSLKMTIKLGVSYHDIIKNDKKIADKLDPNLNIWINYDLYAGHHPHTYRHKNFNITQRSNINQLSQQLGFSWIQQTQEQIREYIVSHIAKIYTNHRIIYLEMPGTKWWSMMPDTSNESFMYIVSLIQKYLPHNGKLCIDIGHIFTRSRKEKDIQNILNSIKKYKNYIGMLHISSAWSYNNNFQLAYDSFTKNKYPSRHTKWLDFQGVIYEKKMIQLIDRVRKILIGQKIVEVCESRLPSSCIKDYFHTNILWDDIDLVFLDQIWIQAKILGYKDKWNCK